METTKATTFTEKCKGIGHILSRAALFLGVLLFGTAAILHTTPPAHADMPASSYGTGKYGMALAATDLGDNTYWYVIVWDTETGRSRMYYGSPRYGKTQVGGSAYQLPSSPL